MTNTLRLTSILAAAVLASACSSLSEEEYRAEASQLESMTCEDLESKLLDAGTSKAVKIVRRMQAEKGCEIKPLLAKNDEFQKQERDRISANRIRSRQAIAPGRAVERLDRRQN